jgi:hypothetical protein
MRNIGLSDFATAGSTFYTQGLRTLTGSAGVKGETAAKGAGLRIGVAATLAGTLAQVALVNYMRTGKIQPAGTPWGSLYTRTDDQGHPKYIDVAGLVGAKRGLRAIGADAAIEAYRDNAAPSQIIDKAYNQAKGAAASPFVGPALRTASIAATGREPFNDYDAAGRAQGGESQAARNLTAAAKNLNPSVGGYFQNQDRGGDSGNFLMGQLGKFGERTGRNPDSIPGSRAVSLARQFMSHSNEQLTPDQRAKYQLKDDIVSGYRNPATQQEAYDKFQQGMQDGTLSKRDASDLSQQVNLTELQYSVKRLDATSAVKVYEAASPAERAELKDLVTSKIQKSETLTEEKKAQLAGRVR